ncbi:MAG: hypothetical protein A2X42_03075 [Candidatus Margulisbacteria bacterium GWF2_38_17]|nr:MAG: hypothetical protein A2X43_02200 [Candidatus Margulisbacteria bacterium GWD2_39_127]OGI00886.1 MAG: hypothetical protein A2X42_03075 [Candidatus Margulisbacteria bacterium GWF2_38_17]OGI08741.1 MAG: hypothetical protein A2X41_05330 [Candidatus Margulisbacteria bacterium GWE2_39_32]
MGSQTNLSWNRKLAEIVLVAVIYIIIARLGVIISGQLVSVSGLWPSAGIALAALLLRGYYLWPGIFLGAVFGGGILDSASTPLLISSILVSLCFGVGMTLEAMLGTFLIKRFIPDPNPYNRRKDVFVFIIIALLSTITNAFVSVLSLIFTGFAPSSSFLFTLLIWWFGDFVGIILVVPIILIWIGAPWWYRRVQDNPGELLLLLILILVTSAAIFQVFFNFDLGDYPVQFLLLPFLLWAAVRFGQLGVVLFVLSELIFASIGTLNRRGPFMLPSLNSSLLLLQAYIGTISVVGLTLAASITEQLKVQSDLKKLSENLELQVRERTGQVEKGNAKLRAEVQERREAEQALRQLSASLEQRVQERTTELELANKELESFSYSVAHDLRSPLRSIDGFISILKEECFPETDEKSNKYFNRVHAAVMHMGQLIEDLLKLTQVSRKEIEVRDVDLSDLVQRIADELMSEQTDRKVEFKIQEGIIVPGDKQLLGILINNLLDNAWKFTRTRTPAVIEFGSINVDTSKAYFVRDNGIGFDIRYADTIFKPFSRLHSTDEFPGTGIGLATVQRVVQRLGGRIWVEAEVDKGATFYFTFIA